MTLSPVGTACYVRIYLRVQLVAHVRRGFKSYKTLPRTYREQQLRSLKRLCEENRERLLQALYHDLHKVCSVYAAASDI